MHDYNNDTLIPCGVDLIIFQPMEKDKWDLVDGMDTAQYKGQDHDFGLKLAKKNLLMLRKKEIIADHHTIDYHDNSRLWSMLFSSHLFYGITLLYRKHIFNKYIYPILIRMDYSLLVLTLAIIVSIFTKNFISFYIYSLLIILRAIKNAKGKIAKVFEMFCYYGIRDILVLSSFFWFFPKEKEMKYKEINR